MHDMIANSGTENVSLLYVVISSAFVVVFGLCLNSKKQGISGPPWARSPEYRCPPITVHDITPPRLKNSEQTIPFAANDQ